MQPAADEGDGQNNPSEDLNLNIFPNPYYDQFRSRHYLNPYINPYLLHQDLNPPQVDVYRDNLPDESRGLPYPPAPSYHGANLHQVQQDFPNLPDVLDPIPSSSLPLTRPNLGDYHPSFSQPVPSGTDGTFTLPSTEEDLATMTAQTSQAGPSRTTKRQPKKQRNNPFIHYEGASSRKEKKRVSKVLPVSDSPANMTSLPSAAAASLNAAAASLPPMLYDEKNVVHQEIMKAAAKSVLDEAVNVCSMLVDDPDVKLLVRKALATAVTSCCHDEKFGEDWAAANLEVVFGSLSAPFELILAECKTLARAKVERGYQLRPSAWSSDSETNRKARKVNGIVNDHTNPLKFIFRKDEETDKVWPFEHEVVWDVVLGVIVRLKLKPHITNLNNLFCTAAAAVHCALWELRNGKMVDIAFSASSYRHMYNQLMDYIVKHITPNTELSKRWEDFKACTDIRLDDILI